MKRITHYAQMDSVDCGPTCLRVIAKYYGKSFKLQTLRDMVHLDRDGVSLFGIAKAAESIGFRSRGLRIGIEQLLYNTKLPCIVHWKSSHFVVVYDIRLAKTSYFSRLFRGSAQKIENTAELTEENISAWQKSQDFTPQKGSVPQGRIYVSDPSAGAIDYSIEDFVLGWTGSGSGHARGVALILEPSPDFYDKDGDGDLPSDYDRIWAYFWKYKKLIIQLTLGFVLGSVLQLVFPFLTQSVVDVGINTRNIPFIYLVLCAQLMLTLGRLSIEFIRSWILLHISTRVNFELLSDFLIKLLRLPISFFQSRRIGDLMQRLGDHNRIEAFLTGNALSVFFSIISLIVFGVVLATYNKTIFFIFILSSVAYVCWIVFFLKARRVLDMRRFETLSKSQSSLVQIIQGMQDVKLSGAETHLRWSWENLQANEFRIQIRSLRLNQIQQIGVFTINEGKNILITFISAYAVINGELSLGAMLALQQIVGQLNSPVEQLIGFAHAFQDAKLSLERINEVHYQRDEASEENGARPDVPTNQDIVVKNLTFRYPGGDMKNSINSIDLVIPTGKVTAIVGASGSGKTTLLKLLLRFYEPTDGDIFLGATSLRKVKHSAWRRQCGVVMQDGFIFSDSVANNIAMGFEEIDYDRLSNSIDGADLRGFVDSLPMGYHTLIGSEGNGLSAGQRQRLLIARAIYKNPEFIFFDEATNSLDSQTESEITKYLSNFFVGKTVIIVAHRLSTVYNADQIIVFQDGEVVEAGVHSDLIARGGAYHGLVKSQLEIGGLKWISRE